MLQEVLHMQIECIHEVCYILHDSTPLDTPPRTPFSFCEALVSSYRALVIASPSSSSPSRNSSISQSAPFPFQKCLNFDYKLVRRLISLSLSLSYCVFKFGWRVLSLTGSIRNSKRFLRSGEILSFSDKIWKKKKWELEIGEVVVNEDKAHKHT